MSVKDVDRVRVVLGRRLVDVILVEFEPKPDQVVVEILTWLQLVPLSARDFDLTIANTFLVLQQCHGVAVPGVALIDHCRVAVRLQFDLGVGDLGGHRVQILEFTLVLINRVFTER